MKRLTVYIASFVAVIACMIIAVSSYGTVTVTDNAKADVEYDSCSVHTYDTDYYIVSEPTCSAVGMKWRACSVCGARDIVQTSMDASNHTAIKDEWLYFPSPTCVSGGTKYKVCYDCNAQVEVADVPADLSAHSASGETVVIIEATCKSEGTAADICKDCGEQFNYTSTPLDPDVHVTSEDSVWEFILLPTCTQAGEYVCYCDNCNEIAIVNKFEPTGYHYHDNVQHVDKEANCTESGISAYHCVECGMAMEEQEIPVDPEAHGYTEDFVIDTAATCISAGEKSKHCLYCDERIEITEIPVDLTAHVYSDEWIVSKEATCSAMGLKHTICTLCGEASIPVATSKVDHSYSDYEVIQESADGLSAKVRYTCTVCGYEKEDIITYSENNGNGDIGDGTEILKYFNLKLVSDSILAVDYENFIISNVARNMSIAKFNANFTNISSCVIYDKKAGICSEEDFIATGHRINYEDINGIVTNYYVSVTGDLDSDGKVTASDARLILRAAAGLEDYKDAYFVAADVDSDGKISAADARTTLRVSANIEYFESTYKN